MTDFNSGDYGLNNQDDNQNNNLPTNETQQSVQEANQNSSAEQFGQYNYSYNWDGSKQHQVKKKKSLKAFAATVTICLFLTLAMIGWSVFMGYIPNPLGDDSALSDVSENQNETVSAPEVIKISGTIIDYNSPLTELYDKVKDSCVTVLTNSAMGSGFVVTEDGYVITNQHVIKEAKSITVVFYDDTRYTATLIGSDSISDIAVLKIEATDLTPIEIGDSDALKIGEQVVAIGTPYSIELAGTMNMGIISGIARNIEVTNDYGTVVKTMTLIQTDTSINPGNSGGPLINMAGQILGINTLKLMNEYEGLGFAIPMKNAVTIINTLIEYGVVDDRPDDDFVTASPKLNVTVMNVPDAIS